MSVTFTNRDDCETTGNWSLVRRTLGLRAFGINLVDVLPVSRFPSTMSSSATRRRCFSSSAARRRSSSTVKVARRPLAPSRGSIPSTPAPYATTQTSL